MGEPASRMDGPRAGLKDTLAAIRNTFKLGGSLLSTWGVAIVVRLCLPRFLGPTEFGALNFADTLTTAAVVLLTLGLDTYIRKEVPVRPEHASDFVGPVFAARLLLFGVLLAGLWALMTFTHRPPEVRQVVYAFALAQAAVTLNNSLAALLHAKGEVGGLALTNIVGKVLWGGGVLAALLCHWGLAAIAMALVFAESFKAVVLWRLARKHLSLELNLRWSAARAVVIASLPFYLAMVGQVLFANLDVSILAFLTNDTEVGWYGAASNLANIALLVTPLINWVLMPLLSRAAARSQEELFELSRRSIELILAMAIPASLLIGLGAPEWLRLAFGAAFVPAARSLEVLAPMFILTYVAIVCATLLIMLDRPWLVTWASLAGMVASCVLDAVLVRPAMGCLGTGGGGVGCAAVHLLTESSITFALLIAVGRRAVDRRMLVNVAKMLGVCAAVIAVDHSLQLQPLVRLALDGVLYVLGVMISGAIAPREIAPWVRNALYRRHAEPA